MAVNLKENQINTRRMADSEKYNNAFSDLLAILGIKGKKAVKETKGAVAQILKFLGHEMPEVPENVFELDAQIEYMLSPSGTIKRRVELLGKWWKDSMGCLLGSTKSGTVIAILPSKWSGYEYTDENGNIVKINAQTAKELNIDAFCFYKSFPQKKLKIKDLLWYMFKSLSKADIAFVLLACLIVQLIGMLAPYITNILNGVVIPSNSMSLLPPAAALLIGTMLGSILISINRSIILNRFQNKLNLTVNSAIMMRMFSLPANFFKNYSAGELASRIGYIAQLCQFFTGAILSTGLPALFSFGYFIQMQQFAPSLVIPGLISIFALIAFSVIVTFVQQSIIVKKMDLEPKFTSLIFALFGGMQKIKIAGAEKRAFAKWAEKYSEIETLNYSQPFLLNFKEVIFTIISSLGTLALYYFAGTSKVSLAHYTSFSAAYGAASAIIMSLSSVALEIATLKPTLDMVKPILDEVPESSSKRKIIHSLSGNVEINNVSFRYSEDGPLILDNITLKIKKGEYIAIVGKTGCGKSTLLRLLLGFEKPQTGAIYYGGHDLNSLDLKTIRQKIGVVMQNGSLFPGDIFSNIIITSPLKTLDDAWEAAKLAGIKNDIKMMPMGMNTLIAEGAGGISGGQKQRIMIARAIIARPAILYFDEATSALDNVTQQHVSESIGSLKCTRMVIAHRLSTVKNCDRILVLDKGKIAEEGKFEDLMTKKGLFYDLAIRQIAQ